MGGEGDPPLQDVLEGLQGVDEDLLAARAVLERERRRYQDLFELAPEGYLVTDTRGAIRDANRAASALLGVDMQSLVGKPLAAYIARDERPAFQRRLAGMSRDAGVTEWETRLQPSGGPPRSVSVRVAPRDCRCEGGFCLRWILHDVTERKRTEDAMRVLNAQLEQRVEERTAEIRAADRAKDQFMAMLAHELRNPLGAILNAVRLLGEGDLDEDTRKHAQDVIERQVRHQARLVDDLLDTTRVVHGKIGLQRQRVDLAALVRDLAVEWRAVAREAGLLLEAAAPVHPVWVDGDPARLSQVVENLLQNAAKFTEPGGTIWVALVCGGARGEAILTVGDTGMGIEPEVLPAIFEAFTQAERSLDRSRGGLGLGLTIVRHLVEMHGGAVSADSPGPGRGATFRVRLPLIPRENEQRPATPEVGMLGGEAQREGLRILIIEDNPDAASTLADLLELSGHALRVAYSGLDGVAAARSCPPDVVLCDLGLPGMDGYAVARALRGDPSTSGALLVAVSGYGDEEDRRRTHEAGFDHHLLKPIDFAALEQVLLDACGERGARGG